MQLLKLSDSVNFMRLRFPAMVLSTLLILGSFVSLGVNSLNWGLDFTGGTLIEVGYEDAANLSDIRGKLNDANFGDAIVQNFGSSQDVLIRISPRDGVKAVTIGEQVLEALRADGTAVDMRRIEFVGPNVGEELTEQGGLAMLVALLCILVYVAMRFEWRFALGSVSALTHDVILTLGLFSVLQIEFDLTVLAAVLAVIGYSLNDTIVVCDRIRENFRKIRKGEPVDIINTSLTQTLNRTIITSLTTVLVLVALFYKGGALIHGFATALLFGVVVGTYSSIYIASSVALALGISKEDLMPPQVEKEGADLVVGHHPHVSQGFEIYKNVPIFYSLGNFTMWKKNLRKNCYHSFFLNIEIQDNKLSNINLVPFQINKNGLNLTSKNEFSKKMIELNSFLPKSEKIWQAYLNRINSKGNLFSEHLSFFYNFDEYVYKQVNKYTNLSKKYSDLNYLKNEFQDDFNYKYILDKWQIKNNSNIFSLLKNIFNPLYKVLFIVKKILIKFKVKIYR